MTQAEFRGRGELDFYGDPEIMTVLGPLAMHCFKPVLLDDQLKKEAFFLLSYAAGCRHCQAHGGYGLYVDGVDEARIRALWTFETAGGFTDAERAVYRFCVAAGQAPSAVTADHYVELREHYSDPQIKELLKTVAISGFLNRYSDALAVVTDQESFDWAEAALGPVGWNGDRHRGTEDEQRAEFPHIKH